MKIKRILALLLVAVTLLSLAACGKKKLYIQEDMYDRQVFYFGKEELVKEFPDVLNPLNPQTVYDSLEYTEKMFYGRYQANVSLEDYKKSAVYMPLDYVDSGYSPKKNMVSTIPYAIKAGSSSCEPGRRNRDQEWAILSFAKEDSSYTVDAVCTYEVSGNTVSFTPVAKYELQYEEYVDDDGQTRSRVGSMVYELGTQPLTYTFSFRGADLTLSNGSEKAVLRAYPFLDTNSAYISFSGTLDPSSPSLPDVNYISCDTNIEDFNYSGAFVNDSEKYGEEGYVYNYNTVASYREDGLFTLIWSHDDEYGKEIREVRQFVGFMGGDGSMVLADENAVYYYTLGDDYYLVDSISQGMTSEELLALEALEQAQVEAIVQKKADLLTDLSAAFQEAGLSVQINETTGEIAMDSTVLFAVDKSDISAEGKEMLSKFMQVYTSVVFNDEYNGFVSRIMVEGHTDTDGTYELNQTLSQARADAVREFCLSTESGIDAAYQQQLAASLSAVGYSWDYPVYAADGTVDMAASRRVAFRFIINVNQ